MKKTIKCKGWDQSYSERTRRVEIQGDWEREFLCDFKNGINDEKLAKEAWNAAELALCEYDDDNCTDTVCLSEIIVHGENGWFSVDSAHKYPSYLDKVYVICDDDASEEFTSYDDAYNRADEWINDRYASIEDWCIGRDVYELSEAMREIDVHTDDHTDVHIYDVTPAIYDGKKTDAGWWPSTMDDGCEEIECICLDRDIVRGIYLSRLHSLTSLWVDKYYVIDEDNRIVCDADGYRTEVEAEAAAIEAAAAYGKKRWVMYCELQDRPDLQLCCEVEPEDAEDADDDNN